MVEGCTAAQTVGTCAVALVGALTILRAPIANGHERVELTAHELVVHTGALWHSTEVLSLAFIDSIEIASGPWRRVLGVADLRVRFRDRGSLVTIAGLRDPAGVREELLKRRDALREATLLGEFSMAREPRDLLLERLCDVLERRPASRRPPLCPPLARRGKPGFVCLSRR